MRTATRNNGGKVLLLLFVCMGLLSCTEHRLHREIGRQFDGKDTITIRMADIVRDDWDTMYVFDPMSHYTGLEHYQNYPDYHDIGRRIVFVKNGKAVFREDEIAVESPYSVVFYSDSFYFTPETAVFSTTKQTRRDEWTRGGRTYYILRPLVNDENEKRLKR